MRATLHFDGACRGNPGGKSAGAAVLSGMRFEDQAADSLAYAMGKVPPKPVVVRGPVFHGTNNEAEFQGLLVGLHEALIIGVQHLEIRGDSKLVVETIAGRWRCKAPHLKPLHAEALALLDQFRSWKISWVPREQNKEADRASNEAIDNPRKMPA